MNSFNKINCGRACNNQKSKCGYGNGLAQTECVRQPGQRYYPKEPCNTIVRENLNENPIILSSIRQVQNEIFSPYCKESVNCQNKEQISMQGHPLYNKMYMRTSECHKYPVHYVVPPVDANANIIYENKNSTGCGPCGGNRISKCSDGNQCSDCGYMTTNDLAQMQKRAKRDTEIFFEKGPCYGDRCKPGKPQNRQENIRTLFNYKSEPHRRPPTRNKIQSHPNKIKSHPNKIKSRPNKIKSHPNKIPSRVNKKEQKNKKDNKDDKDMVETCGQYDLHGPHGCDCHCAVTHHGPLCCCNETHQKIMEYQAYHDKNRIENCLCQGCGCCNYDCWNENANKYEFANYEGVGWSNGGRGSKAKGTKGKKTGQGTRWSVSHKVPFTKHRPSIDEVESKLKHLDHVAAGKNPKKQYKNYLWDHRKTSDGEINKRDKDKHYGKTNLQQLQKYHVNTSPPKPKPIRKNPQKTQEQEMEDAPINPKGDKSKPKDERPASLFYGVSSNISSLQETTVKNQNKPAKPQKPPKPIVSNQKPKKPQSKTPAASAGPKKGATTKETPNKDIATTPKSKEIINAADSKANTNKVASQQNAAGASKVASQQNAAGASKVASQQNAAGASKVASQRSTGGAIVTTSKTVTVTSKTGGTTTTTVKKVEVEEDDDDDEGDSEEDDG